MSNKIIEIIVTPDGQSRVETKGFTGADCRAASLFLEKALGHPQTEQLTSEFFQLRNEQQQLQEGE